MSMRKTEWTHKMAISGMKELNIRADYVCSYNYIEAILQTTLWQ